MEPPEMINAGDLVLKRWETQWSAELAAAVQESQPELVPFLPFATPDYGLAEAIEFTGRSVANWAAGTEFNYALFTAAGDLIGAFGLMTGHGPGVLEVGYWMRTPWAGQGRATAAVRVLSRVALSLPGVDRLIIRHDPANHASAAVATKAGFTGAGVLGDSIVKEIRG